MANMGMPRMELIAAAFILALVVFYLAGSIKIVRQGYQYTIEHFGRFTSVAAPGFNFYPAFFYRVGRRVNMMEQVIDIPGQEIITKDNAMISTDGVVFFQVLDAAKAAYEVSDLYVALLQLTTTNLRTVMGSMDLDETLSKRDEINARLLNVVDHATTPWGVKITRVEIKDIRPPADIVNARILEAEGRKESAFRDSEARERAAQAEATATQLVSDAIASGSNQSLNYFIAQKYVEAIGKFATSPNAKTILFPIEATQLIGTLGGIGELAREVLAPGPTPAQMPAPPRKGPFEDKAG